MSLDGLLRWWRRLWSTGKPSAAPVPRPVSGSGRGAPEIDDDADRRPPPPRHYKAPPADTDSQREARLGAVLQALAAGPLGRGELAARVDAAAWGPGRLDAVVAHGVATGVLVETGDGTVRARYAD